jgi:hypothetical protein
MHNEGHRTVRCDKKLLDECPNCGYTTNNNTQMKHHILSKHATIEEKEKTFKFYCKECDFGAFTENHFTKHKETKKHIQIINNKK